MRVLIADDAEILRTRLTETLSEIRSVEIVGYAESADEVLAAVESLCPDIVILDIRLPGGNGIYALERMKKREECSTVIMFTNFPYLQYRKRCVELGADYFFYKSNEFERLVELVKSLAEQRTG